MHRAVVRIAIPHGLRRGSSSTATCDSGSGWHSGSHSGVRFAAAIPATRATASTSPFGSFPASSIDSVSGRIDTNPDAVAVRTVSGLALTSIISTRPRCPAFGFNESPPPRLPRARCRP